MATNSFVLVNVLLIVRMLLADCPGHLTCLSIEECPKSKDLAVKIEEAQAMKDFGNLGRYYLELDEIPKCGDSGVCCQLQQQGKCSIV